MKENEENKRFCVFFSIDVRRFAGHVHGVKNGEPAKNLLVIALVIAARHHRKNTGADRPPHHALDVHKNDGQIRSSDRR